jgi:hypothetical protein
MQQFRTMFFITVVSMLYSFAFGQSFEGNIAMKLTTGRETQSLQYQVKGEKIRMDMEYEGMKSAFIVDTPAKTMYVVMTAMQAYMEIKLDDAPKSAANKEKPTVTRTGKKETILGYACEQIIVSYGGKETEIWATKGLGRFVQFDPETGGSGAAWERVLAGEDMFPLRVIEMDSKGKQVSRMETTAIEKKSLPDTLFKVPSNFNKMDIPMMGRPDH